MRAAPLFAGAALLLLASSAYAAPELPVPAGKIKPEPDITPTKLMGGAARDKLGPAPLAMPADDVGMSPDPDEVPGGKALPAPR